MKRLLQILFILLTIHNYTLADDIQDIEIEGMSIGDSLLSHFSEQIIKNNLKDYYKNKKISITEIDIKSDIYDSIQVHFWSDDKLYKIIGIDGLKFFSKNIETCFTKQKLVANEIETILQNVKKNVYDKKHAGDVSGESKTKNIDFIFNSGDFVNIACYDWSKAMRYTDHLRVAVVTKEFDDWLYDEAFK